MKNKPLVITHKNCIDGCCAKAILFTKFADNAEYLELDHANLDINKDKDAGVYLGKIKSKKNTEIYVADFCLNTNLINDLLDNNNKVVILDHHDSSISYVEPFEERIRNGENLNLEINFAKKNEMSGAMLTWKYLNKGVKPNMAIEHISAGDIWDFKFGEETKYFYVGIMEEFKEPKNIPMEVWEKLIKDKNEYKKYVNIGKPLREKFINEVEIIAKKAISVKLGGVEGLMVNADKKYTSELGNFLAKMQDGKGFGLVYYVQEDIVKCSLRSIAPLDVSLIAKQFGGGGHKQASAFSCNTVEDFNQIISRKSLKVRP